MMRLLRLILIATSILTIPIFLIRQINGSQSSQFAMVFTNPDGSPCKMPCMFGIKPGETKYEDAVKLLREHPITRSLTNDSDIRDLDTLMLLDRSGHFAVWLFRDSNGSIRALAVERPSFPWLSVETSKSALAPISMGSTLAVLGVPDHVEFLDADTALYYLRYRLKIRLVRRTYCHCADPDFVGMDDWFDVMDMGGKFNIESDSYRWLGFANVRRYWAKYRP
jgi:hypothetical protein